MVECPDSNKIISEQALLLKNSVLFFFCILKDHTRATFLLFDSDILVVRVAALTVAFVKQTSTISTTNLYICCNSRSSPFGHGKEKKKKL